MPQLKPLKANSLNAEEAAVLTKLRRLKWYKSSLGSKEDPYCMADDNVKSGDWDNTLLGHHADRFLITLSQKGIIGPVDRFPVKGGHGDTQSVSLKLSELKNLGITPCAESYTGAETGRNDERSSGARQA